MKLASLKAGGRDGTLVVVSRDLTRAVAVPHIARTLQSAIEHWEILAPELQAVSDRLNAGPLKDEIAFDPAKAASPLPRAYQWVDGSAYVVHVELVRKARGAQCVWRGGRSAAKRTRYPAPGQVVGLVGWGAALPAAFRPRFDKAAVPKDRFPVL